MGQPMGRFFYSVLGRIDLTFYFGESIFIFLTFDTSEFQITKVEFVEQQRIQAGTKFILNNNNNFNYPIIICLVY